MRIIFSFLAIFFWLNGLGFADSEVQVADNPASLEKANQLFESEKYSEALPLYEKIYQEGTYTERMLYRLSFMHENLKNYPEAIYYLKKIKMEYGGPAVENKVKQLLQANGATKFYSASGWDSYIQFFSQYAIIIWSLTLVAAAFLLYHFITLKAGLPTWRRTAFAIVLLPFLAGATLLVLRGFFLPDRAVLVEPTAFYAFPSYAASHDGTSLPIGETVNITGESDIWYEVQAGDETYWVPQWSVRRL